MREWLRNQPKQARMTGKQETDWRETLAAGCEGALAGILAEYGPRLRKMVGFRLDPCLWGRVDIDDVLQDVYLAANRRLPDYLRDPAVPVFVWLRALTQQVLADTYRRHVGAQKRDARRDVPLHKSGQGSSASISVAAKLVASLTSPSKAAVRADAREHLYAALEKMDPIDREVLALRHFEDLGNDGVAEVLGLKKAAASNRYVRALKRLKDIMSEAGFDEFA
jgi:RNA polymerase sigma-70 factor (ECF subfamily)